MKAEQLTLVIPKRECHVQESYDEEEEMEKDLPIINPDAFEDEQIEEKISSVLENKGIKIIRNAMLLQVLEDEENELEAALFKLLDIPDEEEDEDELENIEEKTDQEKESRASNMNAEGESGEGDLDKSQEEE